LNMTNVTDGMNASSVLGQSIFSTNGSATTQAGMSFPVGVAFDSGTNRLYVLDAANHRILLFDTTTILDGMNASGLLGQYTDASATTVSYLQGGANSGPNAVGLSCPCYTALDSIHHRMFVTDQGNNRVLVFSLTSTNRFIDKIADYVLGQSDFSRGGRSTTKLSFNRPAGLAYDSKHDRVFVTDSNNNRILVFDTSTLTNGMNAVSVLGQVDFTSSSSAITQSKLSFVQGVLYDTTTDRLFVGDENGFRVLVFDLSSGIINGMNATNYLCASNFTSQAPWANCGRPRGLAFDPVHQRLFVEGDNNRVEIWTLTGGIITNGMAPSYTLGTGSAGTSRTTFNNSGGGLAYDLRTNRLFASDLLNNRVMVFAFTGGTITSGMGASAVLGQTAFTTSTASVTQAGLRVPVQPLYDSMNKWLYVSPDIYVVTSSRIMVFDAAEPSSITGKAYAGNGTTPLASKTVAVSLNGSSTLSTATTDAGGQFTVPNLTLTGGTVVTVFLKGNNEKGLTVTVGSGSTMSGVNIFQNHLTTRCENGCSLTNADLANAAASGDSDISAVYSVSAGALTLASNKVLRIESGNTYAPGGTVSSASGITIAGTFSPGTNTVFLAGLFLNRGTFLPGTSSFILTGFAQTLTGSNVFYNLTKIASVTDSLTFVAGTKQTVTGLLTLRGIAGALLSLRSSLSGTQWQIDPQGTRDIQYADVQDSNNTNATTISAGVGTKDTGNSVGWIFPTVAAPTETPTIAPPPTGGSKGFNWKPPQINPILRIIPQPAPEAPAALKPAAAPVTAATAPAILLLTKIRERLVLRIEQRLETAQSIPAKKILEGIRERLLKRIDARIKNAGG